MALILTFQFVVIGVVSLYSLFMMNKWIKNSFDIEYDERLLHYTFGVLNNAMNDKYQMKLKSHYRRRYYKNQLGIQPERDYCIRSDTYKFLHPDTILSDINVIRERTGGIPKRAIKYFTYDLLHNLRRQRAGKKIMYPHTWPLTATLLFMHYDDLNHEYHYGKEILCLFQKFNHLPGKYSISHKNNLMNNFHTYKDRLIKLNKSEECIVNPYKFIFSKNNISYIPKTYRLYEKSDCQAFFKYIHSDDYQQKFSKTGPQFITKMGQEVHRGRGINVIFEEQLSSLIKNYENGSLCGKRDNILIAQQYISNPFLYKKHKIEFRIYFLITSTDPLIVHVYKKALIKRCAKPFSQFTKEKAAHVCNTAIVKKVKKEIIDEDEDDDDENEIITFQEIEDEEYFIDWYLEGLQDLLLEQGAIKSKKWLENELYPQIYKHISHIVLSGNYKFYKDPRVSEFFAVDFLMSDELNLFVLEVNYNPQILSVTPERIKRNYKMILDTVEILQAYTKSRYYRLYSFIPKLLDEARHLAIKTEKGSIKKRFNRKNAKQYLELAIQEQKLKNEFHQLIREKLEPEFKISQENLYQKVIDENQKGSKAYFNLIQPSCL